MQVGRCSGSKEGAGTPLCWVLSAATLWWAEDALSRHALASTCNLMGPLGRVPPMPSELVGSTEKTHTCKWHMKDSQEFQWKSRAWLLQVVVEDHHLPRTPCGPIPFSNPAIHSQPLCNASKQWRC